MAVGVGTGGGLWGGWVGSGDLVVVWDGVGCFSADLVGVGVDVAVGVTALFLGSGLCVCAV